MVPIEPGTFTIGTDDKDYWESQPAHEVTLTRGFWIARTETTQAQFANWKDAAQRYPSIHKDCGDCPVENVSLVTAAQYANAASIAGGLPTCYLEDGTDLVASLAGDPYACLGYRIPLEAEWEYAARAGEPYLYAGSDTAADVGWTLATSKETHPVGELMPNAWGLYDMTGNVVEWTWNWFGVWKGDPETDPTGAETGTARVWRGGSVSYGDWGARVYYRDGNGPNTMYYHLGFRLVRTAP
jgi:formylglycine-generating enzyme required for sulfatase activity